MERDDTEDALRNAAHDAFMLFWRGRGTADAEALWLTYCAAQQQYEAYLMARPFPAAFTDLPALSN